MAIGLLGPESQQLNVPQSLVAKGTSADVFTFPSPPTGLTYTGTLQVTGVTNTTSAPTTATFNVSIGGTQWGNFGGPSVYGPVQVQAMQTMLVTCQGLTAGVSYVCTFVGSSDSSSLVQPLYPAANSTALTASIQGVAPLVLPQTAGSNQFTVPAYVKTLIFVLSFGATVSVTEFSVYGVTSGLFYYNQPPYLPVSNTSGNNLQVVVVPIPAGVDSTMTFLVSTSPALSPVTATIYGDPSQYDESVFYNGVAQPAVITTAGTVKSGPFRLLTVTLQDFSATGAITLYNGSTGANLVSAASSAADVVLSLPPNYIVPAGSSVVATGGIGSAAITWAYP